MTCLLIHNDMRDKFTRGNPQEFYYQIRSHSETERIRRAVVLAQYNNKCQETQVKRNMSYYITKSCCCLMCVELLISTIFYFTGSSFSYYENEDRVLGLKSSFSRVFVFVTPQSSQRIHDQLCFQSSDLPPKSIIRMLFVANSVDPITYSPPHRCSAAKRGNQIA